MQIDESISNGFIGTCSGQSEVYRDAFPLDQSQRSLFTKMQATTAHGGEEVIRVTISVEGLMLLLSSLGTVTVFTQNR